MDEELVSIKAASETHSVLVSVEKYKPIVRKLLDVFSSLNEHGGKRLVLGVVFVLIYSFFSNFKVSEAYLVTYLIDYKGFSSDQVFQDIFPIWTYSFLIFVIILGPTAELIQYKLCVVLGGISLVTTNLLVILPITYTENNSYLYIMYIDQLSAGFAAAATVIFFSYMFILVPEFYFLKIVFFSFFFFKKPSLTMNRPRSVTQGL